MNRGEIGRVDLVNAMVSVTFLSSLKAKLLTGNSRGLNTDFKGV